MVRGLGCARPQSAAWPDVVVRRGCSDRLGADLIERRTQFAKEHRYVADGRGIEIQSEMEFVAVGQQRNIQGATGAWPKRIIRDDARADQKQGDR